jgi:nucleoside-diphosphate-sugar epimerase
MNGVRALVTGATGFVGGRLAALLRERGARVRALARPTSDLGRLTGPGVEIAHGDLDDSASLARAAAGCELVFHTAGRVTDWGPRQAFLRDNVEGTRQVIAACRDTGVRRLVHVSSLTVLGLPRDGRLIDEEAPYAERPPDPYTRSKIAGERLVREAHGAGGLSTTVVRPGLVWGPGDTNILPRFIALLRRGRMVTVDGGQNRVVCSHVANLCHGLVLAGTTASAGGQVYHITDEEELTALTALTALAAAIGAPPPRRSLRFGVAYALAGALELGARALGRRDPPPITRFGVRLVSSDCRYALGKARRDLGYRPLLTFSEGLAGLVSPAPGDQNG